MPMLKLRQSEGVCQISHWRVIDADTQQCGNVRIVRKRDRRCQYRDDWRIEVRTSQGTWVEQMPKCRPWGYSGPGAAKRGVALMAAWQRGVTFR